ncbi:hypothetical protein [Chamaesiphon sp. OTE_20_metabat_361]|uniref:hypothetical protein n=1 Tax=Chamaesiphon sp. OTE_20_metabat_361 TaxID=2964689 RepID=UPI00286BE1DD|nr:hypothetical protein [Chamaesiphon sp. OTE_20_metabat_361]
MSNAAVQMLLKEAENLTRAEKVELIDSLKKQIESQPAKIEENNLADFFQSSPLVGVDIDLTRQVDMDEREVNL